MGKPSKDYAVPLWEKANLTTSLLGYGCMRFPTLPDGGIDEARAEALLNTAREAGVNYFDTAYPYHGGKSEPFVGRVIATVWPPRMIRASHGTEEDR